jgi:hypothetical protein
VVVPGSCSLAGSCSLPSLSPHLALRLQLPHSTAHDVSLGRGQAQCCIHSNIFGGPIASHDVQFHLCQERPVNSQGGGALGQGLWAYPNQDVSGAGLYGLRGGPTPNPRRVGGVGPKDKGPLGSGT